MNRGPPSDLVLSKKAVGRVSDRSQKIITQERVPPPWNDLSHLEKLASIWFDQRVDNQPRINLTKVIMKTRRLLPSIALLLAPLVFSSATLAGSTPYYALVDAGSGGSRLYLYLTDLSTPAAPIINQITLPGINRVTPGISSDLKNCGEHIAPLFKVLSDYLTSEKISPTNVTVSLQATAGMRVVSPVEQNQCYGSVQTELKKQLPTAVVGPIQTIQGRYEGAFQWLTVNYLKNILNTGGKTVGVLEVGGGSAQMAFESPGKLQTLDFISVPYGGKTYALFARSYTGLGGNYSREDATDDPNAFQVGFPLSSGAIGTGDYFKGRLDARKSIRSKPTQIPPQAKLPPLSAFVGVGLYENVATDLGLGSEISAVRIDEAASALAKQAYDFNTKNPYEFSRIFTAQLISEMIRTWFSPTQSLRVEDTINGKAVTWTLGAVAFLSAGGVLP